VADALSQKPKSVVASLLTTNQNLLRELDALQTEGTLPTHHSQLVALQITSPLVEIIKERKKEGPELMKLSKRVEERKGQEFSLKNKVL